MNVHATQEELADIAEALKLAALLDDRAPKADKARIVAWAEQIHRHKLIRDDLLNGLQAYYDGPSERAIAIGDLIHHARIVKRNRLEQIDADEQARREALWNGKAAEEDDIRTLTADAITGRIKNRTQRLEDAEAALQTCYGKQESQAALREYFAARAEARKPQLTQGTAQ